MRTGDFDEVEKTMRSALAHSPVHPTNLRFERCRVADRQCLRVDYDGREPVGNTPVHLRQILVPAGSKVLVLNFTASIDQFGRFQGDFDGIANSLQVSAGPPGAVTTGAGAGALIGGVVVLWVVLRRNRRGKAGAFASRPGAGPGQGFANGPGGPFAPPAAPFGPAGAANEAGPDEAQPQDADTASEEPAAGRVTVVCGCGVRLKVPAASSGKKGRCPKCNEVFTIP